MRAGGVVAAIALLLLTGCAGSAPASQFATPGVHIEGSVLLHSGRDNCWTVTYREDAQEVSAPLALPAGFTTADIAMSDPAHPGQDIPGPALMDAAGYPVGFSGGTVMISANYASLDDAGLAEGRARCGWTSAPLVPTADAGLAVDPDGLAVAVYTCTSNSDEMPDAGELAEMLDSCDERIVSPSPSVTVGSESDG